MRVPADSLDLATTWACPDVDHAGLLDHPEGLTPEEKPEILQIQVDEFSALLSDVFNTDAANAPCLIWIFKGALYYLCTFAPDPTFLSGILKS